MCIRDRVNTHGLRGEVKVVPWTDYPEVFEDIDFVYVKKKSEYERLDVKGIKSVSYTHLAWRNKYK